MVVNMRLGHLAMMPMGAGRHHMVCVSVRHHKWHAIKSALSKPAETLKED